jgi:hypothetical protein
MTVDLEKTPPDKLFDTEKAAEILDTKPHTLKTWRHKKRGPKFVNLGALVRYRAADLLSFIRQGK